MTIRRLVVDLEYDADSMHSDDLDSIEWFEQQVLGGELILHSNELGDEVGTIRIVTPTLVEHACDDCKADRDHLRAEVARLTAARNVLRIQGDQFRQRITKILALNGVELPSSDGSKNVVTAVHDALKQLRTERDQALMVMRENGPEPARENLLLREQIARLTADLAACREECAHLRACLIATQGGA